MKNRNISQVTKRLVARLLVGLLTSIQLSGCVEMTTADAPLGENEPAKTGLHYFLPRGIVDVEGTMPQGGSGIYQLSVKRHNEPDRSQRYRLVQHNSGFYDDTTDVHVNDKGLLTDSLSLTSESKTGDIVSSLTDTFVNVATIAAKFTGAGLTAASDENTAPPSRPLKPFKVSFDPLLRSEVRHATNIAERAGFLLSVEQTGREINSAKDQLGHLATFSATVSRDGVFYRPLTTIKLRIEQIRDLDKSETALSVNVPIPDVQTIAVFDLHRAVFVKKETQLTFVDGEPQALHHKKPSEVYGAVVIPANATKKIADALPSISSLFYKPAPKPNADLEAKSARLQAQQAFYNQEVATAQAKKAAEAAMPSNQNHQPILSAMTSTPVLAVSDAEGKARQERTDAKIAELQQEIQKLKSGSGASMPTTRQTDKEKEKQALATPTPGSQ